MRRKPVSRVVSSLGIYTQVLLTTLSGLAFAGTCDPTGQPPRLVVPSVVSDDAREPYEGLGFRIYYREPGGTWQVGFDSPCLEWYFAFPGDRPPYCPILGIGVPWTRHLGLTPGREYEFCGTAYDANGESETCTPVEDHQNPPGCTPNVDCNRTFCLAEICQVPRPGPDYFCD